MYNFPMWSPKKVLAAVVVLTVVFLGLSSLSFNQSRQPVASRDGSVSAGFDTAVSNKMLMAEEDMASFAPARAEIGIAPPIMPSPGYNTGGGDEFRPEERMIVKNGYLNILVEDVPATLEEVSRLALASGGFEVNRYVGKQGEHGFSGSITVRVPVADLSRIAAEASALGALESQNFSGQDVTEEFVDVEAELKNLRATEVQFLEIMKRAVRIEDVLNVQNQLNNVRSQIDRLEGRSRYLQETAALSTLTVSASTAPEYLPVIDGSAPKWRAEAVFKEALRSLKALGENILGSLIWLGVYLPVIALFGVLAYLLYRRFGRR